MPDTSIAPTSAAALSLAVCCASSALALEWRVEVTPDGDVFPALAWSQRVAGAGGDGLVDAHSKLRIPVDDDTRRVEIHFRHERADQKRDQPLAFFVPHDQHVVRAGCDEVGNLAQGQAIHRIDMLDSMPGREATCFS